MRRLAVPAAFVLVAIAAGQCLAKNDIRGIATAQLLTEALETLELDGAQCEAPSRGLPTACSYDDRTKMTLYAASSPPKIEKLVYTFHFKDIQKMRDKLQLLYGLQRGHIEGEHKLYTGERLFIELDPDGLGSLSIVNERQIVRGKASGRR